MPLSPQQYKRLLLRTEEKRRDNFVDNASPYKVGRTCSPAPPGKLVPANVVYSTQPRWYPEVKAMCNDVPDLSGKLFLFEVTRPASYSHCTPADNAKMYTVFPVTGREPRMDGPFSGLEFVASFECNRTLSTIYALDFWLAYCDSYDHQTISRDWTFGGAAEAEQKCRAVVETCNLEFDVLG